MKHATAILGAGDDKLIDSAELLIKQIIYRRN